MKSKKAAVPVALLHGYAPEHLKKAVGIFPKKSFSYVTGKDGARSVVATTKKSFSWFKVKKRLGRLILRFSEACRQYKISFALVAKWVSRLLKALSIHLEDISKPDYFKKEVQNGYLETFRTESIGHVQLFEQCSKGPQYYEIIYYEITSTMSANCSNNLYETFSLTC